MAYNLLCEANTAVDWDKLNQLFRRYPTLEPVPMPSQSAESSDALGISIPMRNIGPQAYKECKAVLKILTRKYKFTVFDLYHGKEIDKAHLKILKQEIG